MNLLWKLRLSKNKVIQKLNHVLKLRFSDYYFYKWIRTKNQDYLEIYLNLTE